MDAQGVGYVRIAVLVGVGQIKHGLNEAYAFDDILKLN